MLVRISRTLKYSAYSALILLLAYLGAYAALYRLSEPVLLQRTAQNLLAGSQRSIRFDPDIQRRLLPRPTVIIRNAAISEPDSSQTAFQAAEIRIGIAWHSIFGQTVIEKLVINQAQGQLIRHNNGQWNLSDLTDSPAPAAHHPPINRLQIHDSRLTVHDGSQQWQLEHIQALFYPEDNGHRYQISARIQAPFWERLDLTLNGNSQTAAGQLQLPQALIDFTGSENSYQFSGSIKSNLRWQPGRLQADNLRFNLQSKRLQTAVSGSIDKITSQNGTAVITALNTVADAGSNGYAYKAAASAAESVWQPGRLASDNLRLDLNIQAGNSSPFNLTAKGRALWQQQQGLQLEPVKITTLTDGNRNQFGSEWEGSLKLNRTDIWQLQAKGLFERQPAAIELQQNGPALSGSLKLAKLDLTRSPEHPTLPAYPALPKQLHTDIALDIGTLLLPELEIHNLQTTLKANAQSAHFDPLRAELYSGTSQGSFSIENTEPPRFSLKQNAQNVQIRPLIEHLFGNSRIQGIGQAQLDIHTQGRNRREWLAGLNGRIDFDVRDGEWIGLNFNNLLKAIFGDGRFNANSEQNSPFNRLNYHSTLEQGINRYTLQAELSQPDLHIQSQGQADLAAQTMESRLLIQSQDPGQTPIPLRLQGPLSSPNISLDYPQMTSGLNTPEEKQKALSETLKKQWDWLKKR